VISRTILFWLAWTVIAVGLSELYSAREAALEAARAGWQSGSVQSLWLDLQRR